MDTSKLVATPIADMITKFTNARYDVALLADAALETIENALGGEAMFMDPSQPAVMLMEMAATMAAGNTQAAISDLRKQYPILAETWEDLYLHMCDKDFVDRFALPGKATCFFAILLDEMRVLSIYDPAEACRRITIPRHTTVSVDGIFYTLLYPIEIRLYTNGVMQATFNVGDSDPLQVLDKNIIPLEMKGDNWIFLPVELLQTAISSSVHSLSKSYSFSQTIAFSDDYYYTKVYYRNDATGGSWKEFETTHTDQVFSSTRPMALLSVSDGNLTVSIPSTYTATEILSGDLRVDIYTTKGAITYNLSTYTEDKFVLKMSPIDTAKDTNTYTSAANSMNIRVFSTDISTGGRSELTFEEVRDRVISNSIGEKKIPITSNQLDAHVANEGFDIVRNVDTLTNLIFLATRKLPAPSNRKIITPANIGIATYQAQVSALSNSSIINNGERSTLLSKAVFVEENSILRLLGDVEKAEILKLGVTSFLNYINSKKLLYTPFYNVIDTSDNEVDLRSYALDQPSASNLKFVRQNQTLQLLVNIDNYAITKTTYGYALRIQTLSGNNYKSLPGSEVGVQLAFYPEGENTLVYINGEREKVLDSGEYIYLFRIETNHDINKDDLICIINANAEGITGYKGWIKLTTEFNFLHWTTSPTKSYVPDSTDPLLGKFILPDGSLGLIQEKLLVTLGTSLSSLWRRVRPYYGDTVYQYHDADVQDVWATDIYEPNADGEKISIVDGKVVYNLIHAAGDLKFDIDGNPVYKYKVGDVVLDELGNPVSSKAFSQYQELDLLVVDGKYLYATDSVSIGYRSEVEAVLNDWITNSIPKITSITINGAKVFYYPKTTLGLIEVEHEGESRRFIESAQSFKVTLYVDYSVLRDSDIRTSLKTSTVTILDAYIGEATVNMTEIQSKLRAVYGLSVNAFTISGLGGESNYQVLKLVNPQNALCLNKVLERQPDGTYIVTEDVTVEFKLFNS